MDNVPITEIGIGGVLVVMVLDKVFNFLKTKDANGTASTTTMKYNVQKIHDFTIRQDLVTKQLVEVQKTIAENSTKQTQLLDKINDKQEGISATLTKIAANGRSQ